MERLSRTDPKSTGATRHVRPTTARMLFHGSTWLLVTVAVALLLLSGPADFWTGAFCAAIAFIGLIASGVALLSESIGWPIAPRTNRPLPAANSPRNPARERAAALEARIHELEARLNFRDADPDETELPASSSALDAAAAETPSPKAPSRATPTPAQTMLARAFSSAHGIPADKGIGRFLRPAPENPTRESSQS